MRLQLTVLAALAASSLALAATQSVVLYEDDFDSYEPGPFLGQGGSEVMNSTVSCGGEVPVGEVEIVEEGWDKYLKVVKVKTPEGVEAPGKDRGVRIPLNWGDLEYEHGYNGKFIITGIVEVPAGGAYAELRLATDNGAGKDFPALRFCPCSTDYKTYIYQTANYTSAFVEGSVNTNDQRICRGARNQMPVDQAVRYDEWCNFELIVDCELGLVTSYRIWNDFYSYSNDVKTKQALNIRPDYIEFTAVGNGYDLNRGGAYFDYVKVEYVKETRNYDVLFEEDFSTFQVGDDLLTCAPEYLRIGSNECFTATIENDVTYGNYAKLWIDKPEGFPKDGLLFPIPEDGLSEGLSLLATAWLYIPDNGVWSKMVDADRNTLATIGYHSADKWFFSWDGLDADKDGGERYEQLDNAHVKCWYKVTYHLEVVDGRITIHNTRLEDWGHDYNSRAYGFDWYDAYGAQLAGTPAYLGIQLQGWNGSDVRFVNVADIRIMYETPEPALLGLLGLLGLAFLRRR